MSICKTIFVHVPFNIVPIGENLYPPSRQNEELWHPFSFSQSYKKQYILTVHSKVQHLFFRYVDSFQEYATRAWHFGFETSRFRDFCQFLEGFGFGSGEFGLGKKNSVSENNSRYRFWSNFWSRHSVYSTRPYQTSRFPYCVFSSVLSWKTAGSGNSMGVNNFWASFSMRSDNLQLTCVQPPNSLQILPLRLFK